MESQNSGNNEIEVSQEELDKLDDNLLEIDILYKSRCVQAPRGSNVIVREIEPTKK